MDKTWDKYFKPVYSPLKDPRQPFRELIYFAVVTFIIALGMVATVNYSKQLTNRWDISLFIKPSLLEKLEATEKHNSMLESEIFILNHKMAEALETKTQQFLEKFNSLLAVDSPEGRGVVVTLDDSNTPLTIGENPNLMVIHNLDLLAVVNELWAAGAVAIAVNDQRITAGTEFKCIGPIIQLNNTRVLPPFTIKAIGEPGALYAKVTEGYVKRYRLESYGIKFSIAKRDRVKVPASSGLLIQSEETLN